MLSACHALTFRCARCYHFCVLPMRILASVLAICLVGALSASAAIAPGSPGEKRSAPVGVGDSAPDFTLEDQDGRKHTLSLQRGRPVVLVFYRGHW